MLPSLNLSHLHYTSNLLPRPERGAILASLQKSEMVLVAAPHNSGLTSFLADVADLGLGKRYVFTSYISGHELASFSPAQCYMAVLSRLGELLPLHWQPPECGDPLSFRRALLSLLSMLPQQVVLVIDDLQAAPIDWLESWVGLLRGICHEQRFQPSWHKLIFLLGTHDLARSPGQDFLVQHRLQPTSREAIVRWVAVQPRLARTQEACLALAAWAGGNPVLLERLLRYAPAGGFVSPAEVAEAAYTWAKAQQVNELPDDAQSLLQEVATRGPLAPRSRPGQEYLIACGWLRVRKDELIWAAPLVALLWRTQSRRLQANNDQPWLLLDQEQMEVYHRGEPIPLNPQEMRILFLLANHPGRFFSAEAIYRRITDEYFELPFSANVRAQIARLRKKLPSPDYLQTRRNVGYAFESSMPYEVKKKG